MELRGFQKRYLRGQAHSLKAIVQVGKHGITEPVLASINEALTHHELVKVKVRFGESKAERRELVADICQRLHASEAGTVGHTVTLYRQHPDPEERKYQLPHRDS